MEHFGYRDQLYALFKDKKSLNILDSFTENGTRARLIDRWGDSKKLFENMPCAFDEFSELVIWQGRGLTESMMPRWKMTHKKQPHKERQFLNAA